MVDTGAMSEYLSIFLDEADEQVDTLDQGLLRLEHEPDDHELLQSIFRSAHSLKGAAAAMGFANMSRLTHAAENLLDRFRAGELRPETAAIDLLLSAVDALKTMKQSIRGGGSDDFDVHGVAFALEAACTDGAPPPQVETAPITVADDERFPDLDPRPLCHVRVMLAPDCEMPHVRAEIAIAAVERVGTVLRVAPARESLHLIQPGQQLEIIARADGGDPAIRRALESVSEIAAIAFGEDPREMDVGPVARGRTPAEVSAMARRGDQTVRVNVTRLDNLMNLVGELVIDRTRVAQLCADILNTYGHSDVAVQLRETALHMARIVSDLQEEVMKARMLPIAQLFRRFPRMVRDLAQKTGKGVDLALEGEETELDRTVIEEMVDPLTHLLRNALDHGIETPEQRARAGKPQQAKIILAARQLENRVIIEVTDDGAGIDVERVRDSAVTRGIMTASAAAALSKEEALQLVFAPGLSTSGEVSDLSGRGVGMDVVRSNVTRLRGSVGIQTKVGVGTTVAVSLPLTLAISQALLVTVGPATVAIPLVYVVETVRLPSNDLYTVSGRLVMAFRGKVLPLVAMSEIFDQGTPRLHAGDLIRVVVAKSGDQQIGFIVDSLIGEQEIVLKPIGAILGDTIGIAGATILGNGTVALALDVASLIDRANLHAMQVKQEPVPGPGEASPGDLIL